MFIPNTIKYSALATSSARNQKWRVRIADNRDSMYQLV